MSNTITEKEVKEAIKGKLSRYFGVSPTEATEEQMYKAVVMSVRDILLEKRQQFHKKVKAKRAKRSAGRSKTAFTTSAQPTYTKK